MKKHFNIRLNQEEYQIICRLADDLFEGNLSQAIRFVIRQYARSKLGREQNDHPTEYETEIVPQESLV